MCSAHFCRGRPLLCSLLSSTVPTVREVSRGSAEEMIWYLSLSMVRGRGVVTFTQEPSLMTWHGEALPTLSHSRPSRGGPMSLRATKSNAHACLLLGAKCKSQLSRDLPPPDSPSSTHRVTSIQHPESRPLIALPALSLPGYL